MANSHYLVNPNTNGAMILQLPTNADSTQGDYVTMIWSVDADHAVVVSTQTNEYFSPGSLLVVRGKGASAGSVTHVESATIGTLDINPDVSTGVNGDAGSGTKVECFFNGTAWVINAIVEKKGDGSDNSFSSFA